MTGDMKLTKYVVVSDRLTVRRTGHDHRVVFSTRSGAVLILDHELWQRVAEGRLDRLPAAIVDQLSAAQILVPLGEDELAAVVDENLRAIATHDVLYQVVQPSAWCQLDCAYCGQEHAGQQLGQPGQQALLGRMRERLATRRYRHLKIGWFGAEPLAGLGVMRSLSAAAAALAREFDCTYSAQIVTNGLALTPAVATELIEQLHVDEAEVTLDGLAADHDRRRFTKGGHGSFDRIFRNLCAVAATTDLRIKVRCNVDRSNAEGVTPLIEALAAAGLAGRVTFYTSPVYAWGNDAHLTALGKQEYAEYEMEWFAHQFRLGFQLGLVPPRRKIVCMTVQPDAEVTDAFGTTFNCTEAPYVPAYGAPNLYQIRPPGPPPTAPTRRMHAFNQQILANEHQTCSACPMLPVCGGHCPKAWLEGHEPCPSAKANMRQRLNLMFAVREMAVTS